MIYDCAYFKKKIDPKVVATTKSFLGTVYTVVLGAKISSKNCLVTWEAAFTEYTFLDKCMMEFDNIKS